MCIRYRYEARGIASYSNNDVRVSKTSTAGPRRHGEVETRSAETINRDLINLGSVVFTITVGVEREISLFRLYRSRGAGYATAADVKSRLKSVLHYSKNSYSKSSRSSRACPVSPAFARPFAATPVPN